MQFDHHGLITLSAVLRVGFPDVPGLLWSATLPVFQITPEDVSVNP